MMDIILFITILSSMKSLLFVVLLSATVFAQTDFETALGECNESSFGALRVKQGVAGVCDPSTQSWREVSSLELGLELPCTKKHLDYKKDFAGVSFKCTEMGWKGEFVDSRDKHKYNMAVVQNVVWMKDRLNYKKFWGIKCDDCKGYHIYDFSDAQKVCPSGWRNATITDWSEMSVEMTKEIVQNGTYWTGTSLVKTDEKGKSFTCNYAVHIQDGKMEEECVDRKMGLPIHCVTQKDNPFEEKF